MFESKTYNAMFEELYKLAHERGPFDRTWSNVPVVKDHALHEVDIKPGSEMAKYAR